MKFNRLQRVQGATVKDSVNVLFEGIIDDGDFYGSIEVPEGGDQSANLVVSGTSSGVILKNIFVSLGAGGSFICYTGGADKSER